MKILIILDRTFANDYYIKYYDILHESVLQIKDSLNCDLKVIEKDEIKASNCLEYANSLYAISKDYHNIIYLRADAPMTDTEETKKLVEAHESTLAYYTYGDNYPKGIVPFVLRVSAFERLIKVLESSSIELGFDFIEQAVFSDPNFFEVEVVISEFDMRYYRLHFYANSKRNSILIENFIDNKGYKNLVDSIKNNHSLRRTLPAYFELDISNTNNIELVNTPVVNASNVDVMTLSSFKTLYEEIKLFVCDFHLSIGSFYEPMLNDDWHSILEHALEYNNASIYFETNALLLDEENAKRMLGLQDKYNNLHVIFHLDAIDELTYNKIYSRGNISAILTNLEYYLLRRVKNVYMYIIKQKDNFNYLAQYYQYFDKYKVNIIMQKYSIYRGLLPNNKVGDMEPLVFVGCAHLLRDLYIDHKGNVPICKYDNKKSIVFGNIFENGIESIWNKGYDYYQNNVDKKLEFCNGCDDWYLYNF